MSPESELQDSPSVEVSFTKSFYVTCPDDITLSGYSWLSNQYGLTIDNIVSYELVLPNGTVTTVTSANSDLFFALKVWNVCTELAL